MLGMMSNNRERGVLTGNVMDFISRDLMGNQPDSTTPSPSNLREAGGAVMRALQAGDVDAFTAGLQRFFEAMEEMEDEESPFDLEVG